MKRWIENQIKYSDKNKNGFEKFPISELQKFQCHFDSHVNVPI